MPWWRRKQAHEDLAAAIRREQQRQYHRDLKQQNDAGDAAQRRQDERAWQRQSSFFRPEPPSPTFPHKPDDGLLKRGAKRFANNQIYDHQISWRRWQQDRAEQRQDKAARAHQQQARPRPPSGSGAGTADNPFIFADESRQQQGWFGQSTPAPEPTHTRGPRR